MYCRAVLHCDMSRCVVLCCVACDVFVVWGVYVGVLYMMGVL